MRRNFFISENDFKVWLPDVMFIEKSGDEYNSRQISGIMTTDRRDRQGEIVKAQGLEFDEFLHHGHFNDNHSQDTSAVVGYPEKVEYHKSLKDFGLPNASGWSCRGYVLKGTKRADAIWELAKALSNVPERSLGFSIEGKVIRREDKTIEKAKIRNVAITNCPVNTDCTWATLEKSFHEPDFAKSMMAGYATAPAAQSGGGAIRTESLDSDEKDIQKKKRKKEIEKSLLEVIHFDEMVKSMELILERRPDFTDEAAAAFINYVFKRGIK